MKERSMKLSSEVMEENGRRRETDLINEKDKELFATLVTEDGKTVSDDVFLRNLARWFLDNTENVNVAQRLNEIVVKLQDAIRKSWNIK